VTYKRWDIVAIDFPFIEGTGSKRRPGLIISSERLRSEYGVYWIAIITAAASGPLPSDIPVTIRTVWAFITPATSGSGPRHNQ
jgi:mRNA-degrading endonuclease toxin of MazEF toxin-antitoxin module